METASILDVLLAIVTIIASFGTALGTFAAIRNQVKQTNTDTLKTDKTVAVEVAERVNAMSLNFAEKLEDQLEDCLKRRDEIENKFNISKQEEIELKLRLKYLATKLKTIIDKHNQLANMDCPGYQIINDMVYQIINEIENKIKEE